MPIPALPFDDAIAWLRARVPMGDGEYAAVQASAKHRAFALAGVAQASLAADVWRALERHLQAGPDIEGFKREFAPRLAAVWGVSEGKAGARLGLVAHNAFQSSYNAGRWAQATQGLAPVLYPYLQFIAVRDLRTSEICKALDGITLPVGDPRWSGRVPPCHHFCRATLRSRRAAAVDEEGGPHEGELPEKGIADEGFGQIPSLTEWKPPAVKLPPPLAKAFDAKPPPPPLPAPPAPAKPPPKVKKPKPAPAPAPGAPEAPPPSPAAPPVATPPPPPPPAATPAPRAPAPAFEELPVMSEAALDGWRAATQAPDGMSLRDYRASNEAELAALSPEQREAIARFTQGYDWVIRELDKGRDPADIAREVDAHRAKSKYKHPDADGAEHVRLGQRYLADLYAGMRGLKGRESFVYRGLNNVPREAFEKAFLAAGSIEISAVSSATHNAGVGLNFAEHETNPQEGTYKVFMKLRQRTAPGIEMGSQYRGEGELLLSRGAVYRITSRRRFEREGARMLIIEAEEVSPGVAREGLGKTPPERAPVPPPYDGPDRRERFISDASGWVPTFTPGGAVRLP